jgi:L-threonylcarbamoyladenylate synthase
MTATDFPNERDTLTAEIAESVRVLRGGGVVALPTDTLYGLAADVFNVTALEKVFAIKERPGGLALPVLIDNWDQMQMIAIGIPDVAEALAARFWPGPLTMVVNKRHRVPRRLTAGADTVAVRMPDHPAPRGLARALGSPITGTSANVSGAADPRDLHELRQQLGGRLDYIVSSGPAPAGTASTVVDITSGTPKPIREGAVPFEKILTLL